MLAFLACAFFLVVDVYFPQISNAVDRKYLVIGDLLFSGVCPGGRGGERPGSPALWGARMAGRPRSLQEGLGEGRGEARGPTGADGPCPDF